MSDRAKDVRDLLANAIAFYANSGTESDLAKILAALLLLPDAQLTRTFDGLPPETLERLNTMLAEYNQSARDARAVQS